MYYIYVLKTKQSIYIGCTSNLRERIIRHTKRQVPATKNILPVQILTYIAVSDKNIAYRFEKYLKSGSGRAFLYKRLIRRSGRVVECDGLENR